MPHAPQDMGCGCQMIGEETSQHRDTAESDTRHESFFHLQGQYTSSRTYTTLHDVIFEGSAGDLQLHQELASGGRRPEREAVGAAGHVRHEQRAGGDHPQPADVAGRVLARDRWPSSPHCLCWAISARTHPLNVCSLESDLN